MVRPEGEATVRFEPAAVAVRVPVGTTIYEAAEAAGFDLDRPCGGRGRCGNCAVRVKDAVAGSQDSPGEARWVLACQEPVAADLVVNLAPTALPSDIAALYDAGLETLGAGLETLGAGLETLGAGLETLGAGLETFGARAETFVFDPPVTKHFLPAELFRGPSGAGDGLWEVIRARLPRAACSREAEAGRGLDGPPLALLRRLGAVYGEARHRGLTVILGPGGPVGFESGDTTGRLLGLAVDIGTTTVAGYLYDLITGKRLAVAATLNRQAKFGADVIARIAAAQRDGSPRRLQAEIMATMAEVIRETCAGAGVLAEDIYWISAVGNSTMHHLFLGIDPTCLGRDPFRVTGRERVTVPAAAIPGLEVNEQAMVAFLPLIDGFLGADTTAVVLATGLDQASAVRLVIDIGTNGEIVVGSARGMWGCSAAAGPALEGAGLSSGLRAGPGAIDDVGIGGDGERISGDRAVIDRDEVRISTIGSDRPRGLCGSGVVAAVAEMLRAGVLTPSGRLASPETLLRADHPGLAARLVRVPRAGTPSQAEAAFLLVPAGATATGEPILFRQEDVRAVQLAKGAIAAAIHLLLEASGIEPQDIAEILLAGAFGNYIDIGDAQRIGLLPDFPGVPIRPVGNAAGAGAQMCLLSRRSWAKAAAIPGRVTPVRLGGEAGFERVFTAKLNFPG